jgi:hypothetical protein
MGESLCDHWKSKRIFTSDFCISNGLLELEITIFMNCSRELREKIFELIQHPKNVDFNAIYCTLILGKYNFPHYIVGEINVGATLNS